MLLLLQESYIAHNEDVINQLLELMINTADPNATPEIFSWTTIESLFLLLSKNVISYLMNHQKKSSKTQNKILKKIQKKVISNQHSFFSFFC